MAKRSVRRLRRGRAGALTGRSTSLDQVQRIVVGVKPVAEVLPEAIRESDRARTAVALEPIVGESMRNFARREVDLFSELLSPAIGAAVRKAVSEAIAALLQRFNEALERSLSVRSLQWRLEARRTGRPFAEVVMLRTLIYKVEQALLIHAPTGLVLQHVVAEGAPSQDPDQVAAMLDALDSFSREAFRPQPAGVHLHELRLGDLTVWVDWNPSVALAVVVRGSAPRQLFDIVRETRERIYLDHRAELTSFIADVSPFGRTRPALESCLQEQRQQAARRGQLLLAVLAALCVIALGLVGVRSYRRDAQLHAYQRTLASQPGIVVTSARRHRAHYRLEGLRDPLAPDPAALIGPAEVSFLPFLSLDPRIVEKRARRALAPPEGVALSLRGTTLRLAGEAPQRWIDQSSKLSVPGVERLDLAELRPSEQMARLRSTTSELESQALQFASGSHDLSAAQRPALIRAARDIGELRSLASQLRLPSCVTVVGHTDVSGGAECNAALAVERAEAVAGALSKRGITGLQTRGGGSAGTGPEARNVRFVVRRDCQEGS